MRLFGFVLVVVCGGTLLAWVTHSTWKQLEMLQKEHAAIRSESFYSGVTLRSGIRSLNGKLLEFGRARDAAAAEAFTAEAAELKRQLMSGALPSPGAKWKHAAWDDSEILGKVSAAYDRYLERVSRIVAQGPRPADLDTFEEVYLEVQAASRELLRACDQLVAMQRTGFGRFLSQTQDTLINHQRLLQITSALILLMAGVLTLLVYRGMIAPLRRGLSQSTRIIERQEKLASLGVLASGVAHEIRNPLTAIKFRLFSLEKTMPALAENEDAVTISNEINRLERIVKDFLRFARPSEPTLQAVTAASMLEDVRRFMAGPLERHGIQLEVEQGEPVRFNADPQQIKQVLINLVQNASEAVENSGTVTLAAREDSAELNGGTCSAAILSVSDTGKGIPPEVEERLFDPFFTTKDRGTGLGLAIAARIVEKHGGILRYETKQDEGTVFEVVLPLAKENEGTDNTAY